MANNRESNEYRWGRKTLKWMVTVDPGLNGTGVALWHRKQLVKTFVITPPRGDDLGGRMFFILNEIQASCLSPAEKREIPDTLYGWHVAIEMPAYQEGATRQMGWKTGDLQKLTLLVGYLCADDWGAVTLVTPREWKGQLPKAVVEQRIVRTLGADRCAALGVKTHAWDAVGIGLYLIHGRV
jgi:hypothetical protein